MSNNLVKYFLSVSDPRMKKKSKHKLIDIIIISICGTICNCDTFVDIEEYAMEKIDWFILR